MEITKTTNLSQLRKIVDHHPWIYNRFCVKEKYYGVFVSEIIDELESIIEQKLTINEYNLCLQDENIVCIWANTEHPISGQLGNKITEFLGYFGFSCSWWYNKEKDTTTISLYKIIPQKIANLLETIESEWRIQYENKLECIRQN